MVIVGCGGEPRAAVAPGGAGFDGAALFARAGCAVCHGPSGRGDGPVVRAGSLEGVDLTALASYRYGTTREEIEQTILLGRRSERGAMPAHDFLSPGERRALAEHVHHLAHSAQESTQ